MHGLRRAIGTRMVSEDIPISTVAQVLGHIGIKATKQYISLDLEGLRKCVLGLDSIGGGLQ
jgi:site-specific recombinase XerD